MAASRSRKPNLLIIQSDSMDGRAMGCMGHPAVYTPHMDRLAERGTLFSQAYCNSPQCCPARASMWSGQYVHQVEAWNNYKGLDPDAPTWRTHLDQAGYRTATFGKTDYVSGRHSLGARVTAWTGPANIKVPGRVQRPHAILEPPGYRREDPRVFERDWTSTEGCLHWLDEYASSSENAPFMLYCGLNLPHPAFRSTQVWLDQIDPRHVTLPAYEPELHPVIDFMRVRKGCVGEFTEREILDIRRTYYAMIAELDAMVGELLDQVDRLGLADTTYLLYLSDHGEMNMEHRQHLKNAMYEPSARVPMIVAGPGVQRGQVVDDLVSLLDVYPTLMDLAGLESPEGLSGCSLLLELGGDRAADRPDWVMSEYHSNFQNTSSFMLRQGDLKTIVYPGYAPQLFDLAADPDEVHDLAADNDERLAQMGAQLQAIVDTDAVAHKVRAYNKASFLQWRGETDPQEYERAMGVFFQGWGPEMADRIEAWLNQ
jgi:arylsulfatase K